MKEDFTYFVFKLISGEEIVALTRIDDTGVEPAFFLTEPLKVELSHKGNHTLVRLIPWVTISEEEVFRVGFDKIITMTELEDTHDMVQAYTHYNITRKENESHKVKLSEKMGYKGNVDQTRNLLEKIFVTSVDSTIHPDSAGISTG